MGITEVLWLQPRSTFSFAGGISHVPSLFPSLSPGFAAGSVGESTPLCVSLPLGERPLRSHGLSQVSAPERAPGRFPFERRIWGTRYWGRAAWNSVHRPTGSV